MNTQIKDAPIAGQTWLQLRDYFAAKALTGLASVHGGGDLHTHYIHKAGSCGDNDITYPEAIAAHCYAIADAMLKSREVKP